MSQGYPSGVDLLLGSSMGLWALDHVRAIEVGTVWTEDDDIAVAARRRELPVRSGPIDFPSAPIALSIHYPRILTPAELGLYSRAYNLHPGLLPFGRGFYPVFWALYAAEPAGATLHRMTARVDSGPIVDQAPVAVRPDDTGGSLHVRVTDAERLLFERWWPALAWGESMPEREQLSGGSYHSLTNFIAVRDRPGDERLVRALTHPAFPLPEWAQAAS